MMNSTRLKQILMPALINVVLLFYWTFITIQIKECSATEVTKRVPRLSAYLRNLSQPINNNEVTVTSPPPEDLEVTTWRPKSIRSIKNRGSIVSNFTKNETGESSTLSRNVRVIITPRKEKPLPEVRTMTGIDKESKRKPEELIRSALINHTLEHGGEEDLDKLVFSSLPQGSKLVLQTVRVIRTDENGDPADETEKTQPTYWGVTLANATDKIIGDDEEVGATEESSEEEDEEGSKESKLKLKTTSTVEPPNGRKVFLPGRRKRVNGRNRLRGRKKPDLITAGSHSAENYHMNNAFGATGREKETGKSHYHGNTHGDIHKHTVTDTDGKDINPYHGTEKAGSEYGSSHKGNNNNHGERFKSSKRKNKGRKVTGFKRVYHKEEFQRTEHFYDDEEARKIAESFGLTEAKEASNHGAKGDQRKYHGVRTDYLDGKQHKNEHGVHDGYDKGQQNTYKDSEKHSLHNNYGKPSHYDGSSPHHSNQNHDTGGGDSDRGYHQHQPEQSYSQPDPHHHNHQNSNHDHQEREHPDLEYHPNHNYDASQSTPKKTAITRLPNSINDKLRGRAGIKGKNRYYANPTPAIISAPIATSFTVTEFSPNSNNGEPAPTPDPTVLSVLEDAVRKYPPKGFTYDPITIANYSSSDYQDFNKSSAALDDDNDDEHDDNSDYENYDEDSFQGPTHKKKERKEPHESKIFFSPKHRDVKEDPKSSKESNEVFKNFNPAPVDVLPYKILSFPMGNNFNLKNTGSTHGVSGENYRQNENSPYGAPNFTPPGQPPPYAHGNPEISNSPPVQPLGHSDIRHPWRWPRIRRPRPQGHLFHHHPPRSQMHHSLPETAAYPMVNQMHLAAIPLRHAHAYSRLGNRFRYRNTHSPSYFEQSTRKSDVGVVEEDEINIENATNLDPYFNHNHRYAKNYLTSTIHPLPSSGNGKVTTGNQTGVRNTLFGESPGVYSTIIRVAPVTMMTLNGTRLVHGSSDLVAVKESKDTATKVTKRPKSPTELISITTTFPKMLPQAQQHPYYHPNHHHRPFIPSGRWPNNPNLQKTYPTQYGPSHHPFAKPGGIMRGLLNPFSRGPTFHMPPIAHTQPAMLPVMSSSVISSVGSQPQMQPPPASQLHSLASTLAQYLPRLRRYPAYRHMYTHNPVNYVSPANQNVILSLGSNDYISVVTPPSSSLSSTPTPSTPVQEKTSYKLNTDNMSESRSGHLAVQVSNPGNQIGKPRYNPSLVKVAPTSQMTTSSNSPEEITTIIIQRPFTSTTSKSTSPQSSSSPTITSSIIPIQDNHSPGETSTQQTTFINNLMGSVSEFFDKLG